MEYKLMSIFTIQSSYELTLKDGAACLYSRIKSSPLNKLYLNYI